MDDDPVASWIHHWLTVFTRRRPLLSKQPAHIREIQVESKATGLSEGS